MTEDKSVANFANTRTDAAARHPGEGQGPVIVTAPCHSLSQLSKEIVAVGVGWSSCYLPKQSFIEHRFEIPLQSAAVARNDKK